MTARGGGKKKGCTGARGEEERENRHGMQRGRGGREEEREGERVRERERESTCVNHSLLAAL